MGMQVNFYLNNQKIELPGNFDALAIELNFDRDDPTAELSVDTYDFYNETATIIEDYLNAGTTGGPGIFEGIPFRIEITKDGQQEVFEKYIDLTDNALLSCDFARVTAKEKGGIEWLNENADAITFEYLQRLRGIILPTDYRFVPYVINSVPDTQSIIIALIGLFVVANQLGNAIQDIREKGLAALWLFSTVPEAIKSISFIVYFLTVLITLVKLITDIIDLLVQPVKYHAGMYAKTLMQRGFEYYGLTLQSSIFDDPRWSRLFVLPKKFQNPKDINDDRLFGFLQPDTNIQKGYPTKTFGEFLREMKAMFNGKFIFQGNNVFFERADFVNSSAVYVIPPVEVEEYQTNASELNSSYLIEFRTDINDKNTIDEYEGTVAQVITEPAVVNNPDHLVMRGLKSVGINYALGKRKETLTKLEEIIDGVLTTFGVLMNFLILVTNALIPVLNSVGQAINKIETILNFFGINVNINIPPLVPIQPVNFGQIINDRIGMLKLENDFINQDKLFILSEGSTARENKLDANNASIVNAETLWNEFHNIEGFATNAGHDANQWYLKTVNDVPFCFQDYRNVKNNARIIDSEGNEAKIISLKWNIDKQTAEIKYRYRRIYTTNLNEQIIVPNGR